MQDRIIFILARAIIKINNQIIIDISIDTKQPSGRDNAVYNVIMQHRFNIVSSFLPSLS